jgi:hypothetical protein
MSLGSYLEQWYRGARGSCAVSECCEFEKESGVKADILGVVRCWPCSWVSWWRTFTCWTASQFDVQVSVAWAGGVVEKETGGIILGVSCGVQLWSVQLTVEEMVTTTVVGTLIWIQGALAWSSREVRRRPVPWVSYYSRKQEISVEEYLKLDSSASGLAVRIHGAWWVLLLHLARWWTFSTDTQSHWLWQSSGTM